MEQKIEETITWASVNDALMRFLDNGGEQIPDEPLAKTPDPVYVVREPRSRKPKLYVDKRKSSDLRLYKSIAVRTRCQHRMNPEEMFDL